MQNIVITSSGKYVDLASPDPDTIDIRDIAHGLSMVCRFGGHTKFHYSVAQHSVLVSTLVPEGYAMQALLHDAAEYVLGDLPTPLKAMIPQYRAIERNMTRVIEQAFDIEVGPTCKAAIKRADLEALKVERAQLLPPTERKWPQLDGILMPSCTIDRQSNNVASRRFLNRFLALGGRLD